MGVTPRFPGHRLRFWNDFSGYMGKRIAEEGASPFGRRPTSSYLAEYLVEIMNDATTVTGKESDPGWEVPPDTALGLDLAAQRLMRAAAVARGDEIPPRGPTATDTAGVLAEAHTALKMSRAISAHYPEPVARHERAIARVASALGERGISTYDAFAPRARAPSGAWVDEASRLLGQPGHSFSAWERLTEGKGSLSQSALDAMAGKPAGDSVQRRTTEWRAPSDAATPPETDPPPPANRNPPK